MFSEEEGGWRRLRSWLLCEAGWCDMHEFKAGKLHSGSKKGSVVKSRKQAIAIGLSEERKAGGSVPEPKKKKAKGGKKDAPFYMA